MISGTASQKTAYRVEVSGWDQHGDFFVEKSELLWADFPEKFPARGAIAGGSGARACIVTRKKTASTRT